MGSSFFETRYFGGIIFKFLEAFLKILYEMVKNEDWEGRSPYQPPIEVLALDATSSTYSTIILVSTLPTFSIDN